MWKELCAIWRTVLLAVFGIVIPLIVVFLVVAVTMVKTFKFFGIQ